MKVKELISKLQGYNQELDVVVNGYEGGCNAPTIIEVIEIKKDYNSSQCYYGNDQEIYSWESDEDLEEFLEDGGIISKALIIRR